MNLKNNLTSEDFDESFNKYQVKINYYQNILIMVKNV